MENSFAQQIFPLLQVVRLWQPGVEPLLDAQPDARRTHVPSRTDILKCLPYVLNTVKGAQTSCQNRGRANCCKPAYRVAAGHHGIAQNYRRAH